MIHIIPPQHHHIQQLVRLSHFFANEASWAAEIPVGQIDTLEAEASKLLGEDVIVAAAAETDSGEMAGYVAIYSHQGQAYLSILVGAPFRCQGVGKQLVEHAFNHLPRGMIVEAWVGAFNQNSVAAMPQMGFRLERVIQDNDHAVQVFTRAA